MLEVKFPSYSTFCITCLLLGLTLWSPVLSATDHSTNTLDTAALKKLLATQPETVLIDVRMPSELQQLGGTIDGGFRNHNINLGWLQSRIEQIVEDKTTPIVAFCGIGVRSAEAAEILTKLGYEQVYDYRDGFFKWAESGSAVRLLDEYPDSFLFRKPIEVVPNVWSAIGEEGPPSIANAGHNNNLSFMITHEGVVVMNAGANALLAQALHQEIKALTDKPVKYVVLENGQGHAMLGSSYWQAQGAKIVAHEQTVQEIEQYGHEALTRARALLQHKTMGTDLTKPDIIFKDEYDLSLGGTTIVAKYLGPAHSPGDIALWLPKQQLVITGDIAFHERLLPVFEHTDTKAWIETWPNLAALNAKIVIPGHGGPTDMKTVKKWTIGYLEYLRDEIATLLDNDGTLEQAYQLKQTPYSHLKTFDELASRNAGRVFEHMEFE